MSTSQKTTADSGYASTESASENATLEKSPRGITNENSYPTRDLGTAEQVAPVESKDEFTQGISYPVRKFFPRKVTTLKPFDKEIPQSAWDRFHDLKELLAGPLYDVLCKTEAFQTSVSIKLKVLGDTEATAKPWIVVFCDKAIHKKVKQFFNKSHVKLECQAANLGPNLPQFQVIVSDTPPRLIAGDVFGDVFCSTAVRDGTTFVRDRLIKVSQEHNSRVATLGGIIRVTHSATDIRFYGMTAGHVLGETAVKHVDSERVSELDEATKDDSMSSDEEAEDDFLNSHEEFQLDLGTKKDDDQHQKHFPSPGLSQAKGSSALLNTDWSLVGHVWSRSQQEHSQGPDLDWALICFRVPWQTMKQLFYDQPPPPQRGAGSQKQGLKSRRHVYIRCGTRRLIFGILSMLPSYLMVSPGTSCTKTLNLTILNDDAIQAGDCGSWVYELETNEVLGHVVASDALGEVYVIPFADTLRDMKRTLGVERVCLPESGDFGALTADPALSRSLDPFRGPTSPYIRRIYGTRLSSIMGIPPGETLYSTQRPSVWRILSRIYGFSISPHDPDEDDGCKEDPLSSSKRVFASSEVTRIAGNEREQLRSIGPQSSPTSYQTSRHLTGMPPSLQSQEDSPSTCPITQNEESRVSPHYVYPRDIAEEDLYWEE